MAGSSILIAAVVERKPGGDVRSRQWWWHLEHGSMCGYLRGGCPSTCRHFSPDPAVKAVCSLQKLSAQMIVGAGDQIV